MTDMNSESTDGPRDPSKIVNPAEALQHLREGNERFSSGTSIRPNATLDRVRETSVSQQPFAAVLACSDSRVPVETVFDQGVGDLFVIRVAGNVSGVHECASVEFAVEVLRTPLVVVLGHTRCGAVEAVISGSKLKGLIANLTEPIRTAWAEARADGFGKGPIDDATRSEVIRRNVEGSISGLLASSSATARAAESGKVKVIGAIYDIETGRVNWLDPQAPEGS